MPLGILGSAASTWLLSLPLPGVRALTSTAVTSGTGFAVLGSSDRGQLTAAVIAGGSSAWSHLPTPPAGTATVSVSGTRTDALVVHGATFTDDELTAGKWTLIQTINVTIPYGSSG